MQNRFRYKHFRTMFAVAVCLLCFAPSVQQLARVPDDIEVPLGQRTVVPLHLPRHAEVATSDASVVYAQTIATPHTADVAVISRDVGDAYVSTRLFGFIPWKSMRVHVLPQETVYVGGQSVGVRLHANGVIVVGFQRVGERPHSPAADASVQVGDVIERMNHHPVTSAADVRRWSNEGTGDVVLFLRRGTEHRTVLVHPVIDDAGTRKLGLYVRDKTSGVGTLTFYDPARHRFGALGHIISDADTGQPIDGAGSLFEAEVTGVLPGASGHPGEKRGRFVSRNHEIGHIERNSLYGVFGSMSDQPLHAYLDHEIPVALPSQVHEGPAKLLTVLHGQTVDAFDVNIENLAHQNEPGTKSMIVHVTDSRLLQAAGGIVQGMSGSPLIQDGRLIGAVTHVFVSDPTRGYGVYAEWMLKESHDALPTDRTESALAANG